MTGQINDLWVSYLQGEGYTGKSYNDLIRQALQDQIPSAKKQINDLWKEYLSSQGFSGTVNDSLYSWLGDKGYSGTLNDRLKQALEAGDLFGDFIDAIFNGGEDGYFYDFTDYSTLYQDSSATTPVTASGQNIEYVLDKSPNGRALKYDIFVQPLSGDNGSYRYLDWRDQNNVVSLVADGTPSLLSTGQTFLASTQGCFVLDNASSPGARFSYTFGTINNWVFLLGIDRVFTSQEILDLTALAQTTIGSPDELSNGRELFRGISWASAVDSLPSTTITATSFQQAFYDSSITDIGTAIDLSGSTDAFEMFRGSDLETVGNVDLSNITNAQSMFQECNSLTQFDVTDMSSATVVTGLFRDRTSNCSFAATLDLSMAGGLAHLFRNCPNQISIPAITATRPFVSVSDICNGCSSLTSVPTMGSSTWNIWTRAFNGCSSLTTFPALDFSSGTTFASAWSGCSSLSSFPANSFDSCTATNFNSAFSNCALDQASVDGILVSLDTAGQSNGTITISGGTSSAPGATGTTAAANLTGKGWTVVTN